MCVIWSAALGPFGSDFQLQSACLSPAQSTVSSATGCRDIPMKGETVRGKCDICTGELLSVLISGFISRLVEDYWHTRKTPRTEQFFFGLFGDRDWPEAR